jgi:hypothetical protein
MYPRPAGAKRRCPVQPSTPLGPDQVNVLLLLVQHSSETLHLSKLAWTAQPPLKKGWIVTASFAEKVKGLWFSPMKHSGVSTDEEIPTIEASTSPGGG